MNFQFELDLKHAYIFMFCFIVEWNSLHRKGTYNFIDDFILNK